MKLFTPLKLRNLELENRWVMSPMCMYSCEHGMPNDFHFVHYGSRAMGGTGLLIMEATGVLPEGRITHKCLGLWNDKQKVELEKIVSFIHKNSNSKVGIQLAHAGRKASTWEGVQLPASEGWIPVAPSQIPYKDSEQIPHELNEQEIKEIVQAFKNAAERALDAGFDLLEIHGAHGYLIHQFLSPLSNQRSDLYGGSFENRIRFLLEIIDQITPLLDQKHPLLVRLSADEYAQEGWDVSQSIALSKILKSKGVDLIDVSSGGNIQGARISVFDSYQVPFAEAIRSEASIKTGAVGLIHNALQAEEILIQDKADLIFVGREILRNPYLASQTAMEYNENCSFPVQYERAKRG
ncbi:NADPH dehydrogenase NamA [Chryseobacterium sp. A301]